MTRLKIGIAKLIYQNWSTRIDDLSELKQALQVEETEIIDTEMEGVEDETNPVTLKTIMGAQLRKKRLQEG